MEGSTPKMFSEATSGGLSFASNSPLGSTELLPVPLDSDTIHSESRSDPKL
jgi:hypothetical protein